MDGLKNNFNNEDILSPSDDGTFPIIWNMSCNDFDMIDSVDFKVII